MFRLTPETLKKLNRFREIKRGYYSLLILGFLFLLFVIGELLINNRALIVSYEGELYFPTYGEFHPGTDFGQSYTYETNYRELKEAFAEADEGNWVLLPLVPYGPNENHSTSGVFRPEPPSLEYRHYLGTDTTSRDILARLFYGTRTAMFFAIAFTVAVYGVGIAIGAAMGYLGGTFDLLFQRVIEIWSNIPFLYMVIIIFSVVPATFAVGTRIMILLVVMVMFSWTTMTYYMRTETYKQKVRDYVASARVIGASDARIVFKHILPNVLATLVTFMPFTVISAITAVTALDFLGFGLPPPTASLGELLKQGTSNLRTAPWIVTAAFSTLVIVLTLVTFIGEAIRESFDPKKFTVYK
ncbi:peptide ABC transporter permease [Pseudohongiella nitratireducens]|uniref:Peptide ABC transporter permease n=1 Tax=Pseudohongiella nitratireducens TaxID=1768907 RepID=A0A917GQK3_9GAMM|nr:ABC transporter permease subunit [Pseudohongiella nitratireducens]MDF1623235.1 ABC transporter permease subunit [Pseudohongiella nitratireducens]GGG53659.1 peptide ABC transporter permease [Pseudohongiella nitratireducens]|tara:strand:+ start:2416 stop:3483 length:1068 start_codon:yes stop_codon:yes gene_type:complete